MRFTWALVPLLGVLLVGACGDVSGTGSVRTAGFGQRRYGLSRRARVAPGVRIRATIRRSVSRASTTNSATTVSTARPTPASSRASVAGTSRTTAAATTASTATGPRCARWRSAAAPQPCRPVPTKTRAPSTRASRRTRAAATRHATPTTTAIRCVLAAAGIAVTTTRSSRAKRSNAARISSTTIATAWSTKPTARSPRHDRCGDALVVDAPGAYEVSLAGAAGDYAFSCAEDAESLRDVVVAVIVPDGNPVDLDIVATAPAGTVLLAASNRCGSASGEIACEPGVAARRRRRRRACRGAPAGARASRAARRGQRRNGSSPQGRFSSERAGTRKRDVRNGDGFSNRTSSSASSWRASRPTSKRRAQQRPASSFMRSSSNNRGTCACAQLPSTTSANP